MARLSKAATRSAGALALCVGVSTVAYAQNAAIDDLKGKIFDAKMAQQQLGKGLRYCENLNGKGFYFHIRDRVLDLEEYFHSLENLAKAEVYNPEKRRPWTIEDAKERWEEVKKQAADDKQKCELVKSLPQLEKQLQELEANSGGADKSASAPGSAGADKSAGTDKKN
jgi:tRNA nucleotidyltransferase/poly(A) polymerase